MGDLLTEDTSYPVSIDSHTRAADLLDTIVAQHLNGPGTAIVALETELGVGLRGLMATLAARLAINVANDGGMIQSATVPSAPPNVPHWYYNTVSNTVFVYNISTASYDAVSTATVLASYIRKDLATTIVAVHTFNPSAPGVPFILGANAVGQLVTGLNADQVDGKDAGAASGLATLDAGSLVVQDPANTDSANTASTIVKRDGAGSFAAQVVTAAEFVGPLTGNADTATTTAQSTNSTGTGTIPYAPETGLQIIRGTVFSDGGLIDGSGYTSEQLGGTGHYRVTFDTAFSDTPSMGGGVIGLKGFLTPVARGASYFDLDTADSAGTQANLSFQFIFIGPK